MTILALEFSSAQRSVAVLRRRTGSSGAGVPPANDAGRGPDAFGPGAPPAPLPPALAASEVLSEVIEVSRGNTMKPLGMIEGALRQAGVEREGIECLAIGLGPGSYNGIRAAVALAQGWQLARGVKLLGVSSAEAVAAEAEAAGLRGRVNVVIDAQRNEFYLAAWEIGSGGRREVQSLRLASRDEVQRRADAGEPIVGPEVTKWFPAGRLVFPRAATLGRLAWGRTDFTPGEKLEPIYLRAVNFVKAAPPRPLPD